MEIPQIKLVCAYTICSGHRLYREDWSEEKNREVFGKCVREHGHEYRVEVVLKGPVDPESGMLINGFAVDEIVKPILMDRLDHHFLNHDEEFFKKHLPTAEWLAYWVYQNLTGLFPRPVELTLVRVYETKDLMAEYPA